MLYSVGLFGLIFDYIVDDFAEENFDFDSIATVRICDLSKQV